MAASVINPPNAALVDVKTGRVTPPWYRYFCSLLRDVEGGEAEQENALLSSTGIKDDLSLTQDDDRLLSVACAPPPFDDPLPALPLPYDEADMFPPPAVERLNLDATAGLVEQTGFDTFVKRLIGAANPTDVLTRADGDARYVVAGQSSALNIRTITATATPASDDYCLLCDATTGAIVVNLPAAASSNRRILTIKKIDASANSVTIDPNAAELIDGAATMAWTTQWQSYTIQCNGTAWYVL